MRFSQANKIFFCCLSSADFYCSQLKDTLTEMRVDNGDGSFGIAFASMTRGPRFESRQGEFYYTCVIYLLIFTDKKKKMKQKEAGNGPFFEKKFECFRRSSIKFAQWRSIKKLIMLALLMLKGVKLTKLLCLILCNSFNFDRPHASMLQCCGSSKTLFCIWKRKQHLQLEFTKLANSNSWIV